MNHAGEIDAAERSWCARTSPIITTVEPVHLEFFASVAEIAEAKAEIFAGLEPGGTAILNRDNAHFELLAGRARDARRARRFVRPARGGRRAARGRGSSGRTAPTSSSASAAGASPTASARPARTSPRTRWRSSRRSMPSASTSKRPSRRLPTMQAAKGRGARLTVELEGRADPADRRELQRQPGLHALGARRPWRPCRATAFRAASPCSATCWSWGRTPGRCTRASRKRLTPPGSIWSLPVARICSACSLPCRRRGAANGPRRRKASWLRCSLPFAPGDVVMVKGSLGSAWRRSSMR